MAENTKKHDFQIIALINIGPTQPDMRHMPECSSLGSQAAITQKTARLYGSVVALKERL